jgi:hypothetical protein
VSPVMNSTCNIERCGSMAARIRYTSCAIMAMIFINKVRGSCKPDLQMPHQRRAQTCPPDTMQSPCHQELDVDLPRQEGTAMRGEDLMLLCEKRPQERVSLPPSAHRAYLLAAEAL